MADRRPRVVSIGGLDPTGGAGITADARVAELHEVELATVMATWTVQDRRGLHEVTPVPLDALRRSLAAVAADAPIDAVKTGLLADADACRAVADWLSAVGSPVLVVDPVLGATAGGWAATEADVRAILDALVARAAVVTPNRPELQRLAGGDPQRLLAAGAGAVLLKDGHGRGDEVVDELWSCAGIHEIRHRRHVRGPIHGTGCALASALAARLARGEDLAAASAAAVQWLGRCIEATAAAPGGLPVPLRLVRPDAESLVSPPGSTR